VLLGWTKWAIVIAIAGLAVSGAAPAISRDIPLRPNSSPVENQSGSTYHIGLGNEPLTSQPEQTLNGLGMVKSEIPASNFLNVVASTSPDDFNINFNKATNTLFANLTVKSDILGGGDGATSAYHIGFGDPATPANKSAYIDDVLYAAIETPRRHVRTPK